ncbi:hypothetical protein PQG02_21000 [Nostoc sp. UHCC 0926]|uniref:hypothetical protein n=1 Tax=unclassified Nostoc TaxID=2593658 RepID=UPI00236015AE|nr:hypothetical protein [Nostoc sp. UHCC 0926]WDD31192.1 hypothetical protein PQG02_21000 [Nostoc sp. UHCC 0926]
MVQTSASTRTVELITVDTALAAVKAALKESHSLELAYVVVPLSRISRSLKQLLMRSVLTPLINHRVE